MQDAFTVKALKEELGIWEDHLWQLGYLPNTVHTYVDRSTRFLAWLEDKYPPQP